MISLHFIETEKGNDYFIVNKGDQPVVADSPEDPILAVHELDMTEDEFASLANLAMTHKLKYDTVTNTVIAIPFENTDTDETGVIN